MATITEDYKEKLKEALNSDNTDYEVVRWIEQNFPELKENEGEKIKKKLKALVAWSKSYSASGITEEDAETMLDWLEKQGEQKPAEWSEEDEGFLKLLLAIFTNEHPNGIFSTDNISVFKGYCVTSNRIITWLNSLKERYTWRPSDEQMDALEHFVRSIGERGYASPYNNNTKLLYSLLEQLKKLKA